MNEQSVVQGQEQCKLCKDFYPSPVGHHHTVEECLENQLAKARREIEYLKHHRNLAISIADKTLDHWAKKKKEMEAPEGGIRLDPNQAMTPGGLPQGSAWQPGDNAHLWQMHQSKYEDPRFLTLYAHALVGLRSADRAFSLAEEAFDYLEKKIQEAKEVKK